TLAGAWADPLRRDALVRWLRLARLLDHPGARRIRSLDLEACPPRVVLDPPAGPTLAEHLAGRLPLPSLDAVALVLDLAGLLHAAHRLGLGHGQLTPDTIRAGAACLVQVDFTGLAVHPGEVPRALPVADTCAADVAAVAALLAWLLPGNRPGPAQVLIDDVLHAAGSERPSIGE